MDSFWVIVVGCIGAGAWLFLDLLWCRDTSLIYNQPIPSYVVVVLWIALGGCVTHFLTYSGDSSIATFMKGFGWPGTFVSLGQGQRQARLRNSAAGLTRDLSDGTSGDQGNPEEG